MKKLKIIFFIFILSCHYRLYKKNQYKPKVSGFNQKLDKINLSSEKKSLIDSLKEIFNGSLQVPKGIKPIKDFKISQYLGTWYEIARLNHRFETGLCKVTANYQLNKDGTIRVENRGQRLKSQDKYKVAIGVAKKVNKSCDDGHLKVSFFRPFYGSYVIFYIENKDPKNINSDYSLALVTGSSKKYLWILSKTPKISEQKLKYILNKLKKYGFNTNELIYSWGKYKTK